MLGVMATVELKLPHHRYEIRIAPGLLSELGREVRAVAAHGRAAVIVDQSITSTHGQAAAESLQQAGYQVHQAIMPLGEQNKTLATFDKLQQSLLDAKLERRSPVVAVGGGITGDVVGFVAATYLRGVPLVQCPTTLLAMVDASVGGKVGVNVTQGKNLIGAFYQPQLVMIDTDTLNTLPPREVRCGLAECIKHGVIRDAQLFDWIEQHAEQLLSLDSDTMVELIEANVRIKAAVVTEDEMEAGVRAHLNFGHTFAHAIESTTDYNTFKHGEAVGLGMTAAAHLAADLSRCDASVPVRLLSALQAVGLPVKAELPATDKLLDAMTMDKKVADGKVRLVLPDRIGAVSIVNDVPTSAIAKAWDALGG
jgi:3-dehydroquinate synthase